MKIHQSQSAALGVLCIVLIWLPLTSQAYSCKELAADNLRKINNQETIGGFESIEKKLSFVMDVALEGLTVSIAEDGFKTLISQGASTQSAYFQSVNRVFREMLKIETRARSDLNDIFSKFGGMNVIITKICSGGNMEIEDIFRSAWFRTQQDMNK